MAQLVEAENTHLFHKAGLLFYGIVYSGTVVAYDRTTEIWGSNAAITKSYSLSTLFLM